MVANVAPVSYFCDMAKSQKGEHVGRPTIFKKGPLTAAERQRRHRRKLHREQRAAEVQVIRERNRQRSLAYQTSPQKALRDAETKRALAWRDEWLNMRGQAAVLPNGGPADELARQIAEYLIECAPGVTISDIRAAIDRRFGPP
jgi:hypothetical protein